MTDNDNYKIIKGTDDNDYINPDGNGYIEVGKGSDTVVISENDFFNIDGFQGTDFPSTSKKEAEFISKFSKKLYEKATDIGQRDELLMFIEPEKEATQKVQFFYRGGSTYVQIYDEELNKVVAGTRVEATDFKIKVVGENGSLGVYPEQIDNKKDIDQFASDINQMIAKGEIARDKSLQEALNKKMDEGKSTWNPLKKVATKFYEKMEENKRQK